ncbi:polysaccharide biosynthesis tyrosine autokinase [Cellulomonas dongxiuzhuiae]|uniref:polysaccharide biosynthesis tyrosine autokinase n=1 Tax=Cellulomonas dongxiuzhuiae TaxID=2819979 RepID=UPI001AAF428C|nr:polysaccharide biosynthesis tyrosine autokinase [Cellulomonas dongxiuzhuiae]MBO3088798.1 polysaccharide biosynthesis tyrosine autokinase [Cellulomonas dongxiuzhuiae]
MDLRDYLALLRKHWASIVALGAVFSASALGVSLMTTPIYKSSTQLYVSVRGGSSTTDMLQGATFTRQQVSSYVGLVTSPLVLGPVIDDLALDMRADDLASRIVSDSPANSSLINITVANESPAVAAAIANAVADEFRQVVADLEEPAGGGPSNVKLTVVRVSDAPSNPSEPNTRLNTTMGLLIGIALGVGTALLREMLDTRVRSEADVAQLTDGPVVGVIAFDEDAATRPLIVQSAPHSPRAEAFRRLRTNVQFLTVGTQSKSIVVTSSLPGEGKSTTTINLAIALADAGTSVALVDADLRRPSIANFLGLEGGVGLTTVLIGRATVAEVVQPWGNGQLHVIPSGQIPPNPSELLGSPAMASFVESLASRYDVVLIDTPPLLPVTDAAVLSKIAGGVLMVVGAGKVHRNQFTEALGMLESVSARTLGLIVNREPRERSNVYQYYRYSSRSEAGSANARSEDGAVMSSADTTAAPVARNVQASSSSPRPSRSGVPSWPAVSTSDAEADMRPQTGPQRIRER